MNDEVGAQHDRGIMEPSTPNIDEFQIVVLQNNILSTAQNAVPRETYFLFIFYSCFANIILVIISVRESPPPLPDVRCTIEFDFVTCAVVDLPNKTFIMHDFGLLWASLYAHIITLSLCGI